MLRFCICLAMSRLEGELAKRQGSEKRLIREMERGSERERE